MTYRIFRNIIVSIYQLFVWRENGNRFFGGGDLLPRNDIIVYEKDLPSKAKGPVGVITSIVEVDKGNFKKILVDGEFVRILSSQSQ